MATPDSAPPLCRCAIPASTVEFAKYIPRETLEWMASRCPAEYGFCCLRLIFND